MPRDGFVCEGVIGGWMEGWDESGAVLLFDVTQTKRQGVLFVVQEEHTNTHTHTQIDTRPTFHSMDIALSDAHANGSDHASYGEGVKAVGRGKGANSQTKKT